MRILDDDEIDRDRMNDAAEKEQRAEQSSMESEKRRRMIEEHVVRFVQGNSRGRQRFLQTMMNVQTKKVAGLMTNDGLSFSTRHGCERMRFINYEIDTTEEGWRKKNMIEVYELPFSVPDLIRPKDMLFLTFRPYLLDCDENGHLIPRAFTSSFEADVCALYDFDNKAYVVKDINDIIKETFLVGEGEYKNFDYGYVPIR